MDFHSLYLCFKSFKLLVISVTVLVAGLGVFYVVLETYVRYLLSLLWPSTKGVITRSEIEILDSYTGDPEAAPDDWKYPLLEFTFTVTGKQFQSRHHGLIVRLRTMTAEKFLVPYPKGAAVTVYYNPANPEKCVLDRSFPKHTVVPSVIMVSSVCAVWYGFIVFFLPYAVQKLG